MDFKLLRNPEAPDGKVDSNDDDDYGNVNGDHDVVLN